MALFEYEARDVGGERRAGQREGVSAAAVAQDLSALGWIPTRISELTASDSSVGPTSGTGTPVRRRGRKVTIDELVLFSHQMASLTRAGVSIVVAARGLSESAKNPVLRQALADIAGNLEAGMDLASCVQRHPTVFPPLYASVIHVGENTGRLDDAFRQIARYLELEREAAKRVREAFRYPLFVLGTIVAAIVLLNILVIPAFAEVFAKFNAELPWQTQAILAVSGFMERYLWVIALLLGLGVFALRRYRATPLGRRHLDRLLLRMPLLGNMLHRIVLARFCQTFAMVNRAGIPLNRGLAIVSGTLGNAFLSHRIDVIQSAIERGTSLTQAARTANIFTPIVLQMISVGESTGSLDELMEQSAQFYEEEVDYELKRLTDAIEPILVIAIGAMVLVLALGIFLPLWDLSGVANR
ncbi:MAG: type II secretion system F family protein [Pseudomonadota bacterium]